MEQVYRQKVTVKVMKMTNVFFYFFFLFNSFWFNLIEIRKRSRFNTSLLKNIISDLLVINLLKLTYFF